MCGIAGIFGGPAVEAETLRRMTRALAHRGPDDEGLWIDAEARVGFGHRRLSIIDLSPAGHQPMHSASGRYVITLNGEIYNYRELRAELEAAGQGAAWHGHSDTEVLLSAFDSWGIKPTLQRATGMFALGLWDKKEQSLTLARDRLGEKPLYYGRGNSASGAFLFASELKSFRQFPDFQPEIDRQALDLFLRHLAVPAPLSIYRGVSKVQPGSLVTLREGAEPTVEPYWSGADVAIAGAADPIELSADEAAAELESLLEGAVDRQLMSDVPLGAFLSGGIDSSTIVAMMQKQSNRPVKTFTVGFHDEAFDEAGHAKAVASHLGTDHTELYVSGTQALDVIPRLPTMYDEPFADSSQIPTHLISALARTKVSVALTGDGGDELFGGYDRYLFAAGLWDKISKVPQPLRRASGRAMTLLSPAAWTVAGDALRNVLPAGMRVRRLGEKVHKAAPMLGAASIDRLYDGVISVWPARASLVVGAPAGSAGAYHLNGLEGAHRMMALDMLGYLPSDILTKVDRASMAVSLETRVPFLDPEVVSFAWRLPLDLKIRGGTTKWLLRKVLHRHVPASLIERPKTGFGVPLDDWLRGSLRDWAAASLDNRRLKEEGFLHPEPIAHAWQRHLKGENNGSRLWGVLMFQSWLEAQTTRVEAGSSEVVAVS